MNACNLTSPPPKHTHTRLFHIVGQGLPKYRTLSLLYPDAILLSCTTTDGNLSLWHPAHIAWIHPSSLSSISLQRYTHSASQPCWDNQKPENHSNLSIFLRSSGKILPIFSYPQFFWSNHSKIGKVVSKIFPIMKLVISLSSNLIQFQKLCNTNLYFISEIS